MSDFLRHKRKKDDIGKINDESKYKNSRFESSGNNKVRGNMEKEEGKFLKKLEKYEVDEEGNLRDSSGKIVDQRVKKDIKVLSINKVNRLDKKKNDLLKDNQNNKIKLSKRLKIKQKGFKFEHKGFFQAKQISDKKIEISKALGLDFKLLNLTEQEEKSLISLPIESISSIVNLKNLSQIPEKEWWDEQFESESKSYLNLPEDAKAKQGVVITLDLNEEIGNKDKSVFISHLIQHPPLVKNEFLEKQKQLELPNLLTKKERKRLIKLRREKKNEEIRNKQHLGIIKAPEPKLTYKNYLRILPNSIDNPTKAEDIVKKAYERRHLRMIKENESRKLTKRQRKEKLKKKFNRDLQKECRVQIYKITGEIHKSKIFKIIKNAKQLFLSGFFLQFNDVNMIYVEGGPVAIGKYETLLLKRIKWEEELNTEEIPNPQNPTKCRLLWTGSFKSRLFKRFKSSVPVNSESEIFHFLEDKKIEYFWNFCKKH